MLTKFAINGFKRFRQETTLELDGVTVLVGANNSGKSTVLQALSLFQYCIETTRAEANGRGLHLTKKTVAPDEFGVLPVAEPADLWPGGRVTVGGKPSAIKLTGTFDNGAQIGFDLKISYNRFSIVPSTHGAFGDAITDRAIRLIPLFSGFAPREEFLTPPARQDRIRLQRQGEMIRNLLWELRDSAKPQWDKLVALLASVFPDSGIDVHFDIRLDRFLTATYRDDVLSKPRDITTAGSGYHQMLQILASVLQPGAGTVLLDEPDAHLHARLQGQLLGILANLAAEEGRQFILATHSPQILSASPAGSVRVCLDGRIIRLSMQPEQVDLLDALGAMDRMELIPLLTNRAVAFVEDKRDRKLLEHFARRLWGDARRQEVWRSLTFLYTHGSPLTTDVLGYARQVRDLMESAVQSGQRVRVLVIGDRDYRTDRSRNAALRERRGKAKDLGPSLDVSFRVWSANEIENYLLDSAAIMDSLDGQAGTAKVRSSWRKNRKAFASELARLIEGQRESVRQAIAEQLQIESRHALTLRTAEKRADEFLQEAWTRAENWCDAKVVFRGLRQWLQERSLPLQLDERRVIDAMASVPDDVRLTLNALARLASKPAKRRTKRRVGLVKRPRQRNRR